MSLFKGHSLPKTTLLSAASFLFCVLPALAQNGQIQGVLVDASGASIANAHVVLKDTGKGTVVRETNTGADGNFNLQPLGAGTYAITAESTGMKTLQRTGITLDVNQILNLGSLEMSLGSTTEQVTVEATVPLIESTTAQKSFTITSKQVLVLLR
jgi:Carboxypeptidase regulatory-like domain